MAESCPSDLQFFATFDPAEDGWSLASLPTHLLSRQAGEKRKLGAEYTGDLVAPLNKRLAYGTSHAAFDAGFLACTQSPVMLDIMMTNAALIPEERYACETRHDVEGPPTSGYGQEQRLADFVSKSIDNLGQDMHVKDGMKYLGLRDAKDTLPGMEVRLIPHQIIGVSWMLKQEKETKYRGGIMADEMGLGKTVQMIATMAMNMPGPDENNRTTLVVVPAALLQQWKEELESKSNNLFSVHIHHGKTKLKSLSALREKDVIITTYQTLCLDFVVKDPHVEPEDEARYLAEHGGLLARLKWYRVVLDEAQFIRNRATRASKVVAQLRAKFRWMLTGTPVTNTLADLYGLIRFGHFRPWNDWQSFHEHIAKIQGQNAPLASSRAQGILKPILLRRTKDSTLEGKPLLTLPPKSIELEILQFSTEEREIYDDFEKQAKIRVNRFIREGTIIQNHSAVLAMILRLRQLCCHPNLILSQADEDDEPTLLVSGEGEDELGCARRVMGSEWVANLKRRRALARAREIEHDFTNGGDEENTTCPVCYEVYENNGRILKCGHEVCADCLEDMRRARSIKRENEGENPYLSFPAWKEQFEEAAAKDFRPCPVCKTMNDISPNAIFLSSAFEPTHEELRIFARSEKDCSHPAQDRKTLFSVPSTSTPKVAHHWPAPPAEIIEGGLDDMPYFSPILARTKKEEKHCRTSAFFDDSSDDDNKSGKVKSEMCRVPSSSSQQRKPPVSNKEIKKPSQRTVATWCRGDDDMEPSAKMLALIEQLRIAENAGDKTIVFSQWTSMLDLVETLLVRHGIQSLRYDGKLRSEARDAALVAFREKGGLRLILISTRCGGVGLNLTTANRVVNMDLSWNYATESQAYDRVHRPGQEKDVFVKRLVVKNTIEERMLRLQDVKKGLADAALGEGAGGKLQRLSVKEIKTLFGMSSSHKHTSS